MNTYFEHHPCSRIIRTNFQVPNWSYPTPQRTLSITDFPLPPEEVHPHPQREFDQASSPLLTAESEDFPIASKACPECRGQKYNFTAYFHSGIFRNPPHSFLKLIEGSYVLRNRLLGLLISYVVHEQEIQGACSKGIEKGIKTWRDDVEILVNEVRIMDSERTNPLLLEVMCWSDDVARGIWQHISRVKRLEGFEESGKEISKARKLAIEFRRVWEGVWVSLS